MIRCKFLIILLACIYCNATSRVKQVQDDYLYKNIIAYLDEKKFKCDDMYNYVCGNNELSRTSEHAPRKYCEVMNRVEKILSSNDTFGYTSIAVEQELYQQCLSYGNEDREALKEIKEKVKVFEELLVDVVTKNLKWQKIDHKIAKLGLGHAFFNIKVIRDPSNSRKRIIMVEPPSLQSLNNLRVTLDNIIKADLDKAESSNKTSIISFYKAAKRNGIIYLSRKLIADLIKIIEETTSVDRTKILSEKMTIAEWSKKYNRKSKTYTTEINWPEIILHEFYKVNINLYDSEPLIVKNIHYFSKLFNTLFVLPNDIIGVTVVAKAASENLRYIDWKFAQGFLKRDRATFCKAETKLYGVSHKILFDLCKDAIDKQQTRKIQEIVYNILEDVKGAIYKAQLSLAEESYLLTELQDITTHIELLAELQNFANTEGLDNWSPRLLPEYYEMFKRSNSYFNSILNYREMLKLKELRSLKSPSETLVPTPFSLVELHVPANRFILNVFFNRAFFEYNYYKEQVFGTYGAKLATLAYGLLNENKAMDHSYYDYDLRAEPDFVLDETNCIQSDNTDYSAIEENRIISSSVGLDLAFSAMSKPISSKVDMPAIINPLRLKNIYKSDQIFFLAYSLTHCNLNNATLNDIISRSSKFSESFTYCQSQCKYEPFKNVDKNIFLIKL